MRDKTLLRATPTRVLVVWCACVVVVVVCPCVLTHVASTLLCPTVASVHFSSVGAPTNQRQRR